MCLLLREGLELVAVCPVVELVLKANDLLKLLDLTVGFVTHQCAIEVHSEQYEDNPKWHHDTGGGYGCSFSRADGAILAVVAACVR